MVLCLALLALLAALVLTGVVPLLIILDIYYGLYCLPWETQHLHRILVLSLCAGCALAVGALIVVTLIGPT